MVVQDLIGSRFQLVRRRLRNVLLDLRYGRVLYGGLRSRYEHLGARATSNSDSSALEFIFENRIAAHDVLVDVGCGKGRVLNWWLSKGMRNRMIGIELDEKIAEETRARLRRFPNVEIIAGNVIDNLPEDGTLFYLFNPFNSATVKSFKTRLEEVVSRREYRGATTIIYFNCAHLDVFETDAQYAITTGLYIHAYAIIELRGK
jgi:hypothetical protein